MEKNFLVHLRNGNMRKSRVIPCLLIEDGLLVKTKKFKDPTYIGDPINTIKIFNEKEVDEIIILDIAASRKKREPNFELIAQMAGEAFMPVTYGGGVKCVEHVKKLIRSGVEKIIINSDTPCFPRWMSEAISIFGSQAFIGGVDVKKTILGKYNIMTHSATKKTNLDLHKHITKLASKGFGEIFINSIDKDGTMSGYDLELIKTVVKNLSVPLMVCGGAGNIEDLVHGAKSGASALVAGSMFVFYGKHRAVLINYFDDKFLIEKLP